MLLIELLITVNFTVTLRVTILEHSPDAIFTDYLPATNNFKRKDCDFFQAEKEKILKWQFTINSN